MINTTKLNGWTRIWIVLTGLWSLIVLLNFDYPETPLDQLRSDTAKFIMSSTIDKAKVDGGIILANEMDSTLELTSLIHSHSEEFIFNLHHTISASNNSKIDELDRIRSSYEVAQRNWPEVRDNWIQSLLLTLLTVPSILYAFGYLVNFVRLGFAK